jgi:CRISPR type III-A-associated RAMP protein Csm5
MSNTKIRLRTLTPLHIGTGEELAPLDYVALKEENQFYRITQDQMSEFLKKMGSSPLEGPRAFAQWISEQHAAMRYIRDNRALSQMADQMNPYAFCEAQGKAREFKQFIKDKSHKVFSAPVTFDDFTRNRHRNDAAIPLGRVREAIKDPKGERPVLPGTSIKGAIRTAVFYHYLTNYADSNRVEKLVRDQLDNRRSRKERFALPLIHDAFYCGIATESHRGKRLKTDDEKMDLFKLVRCRDAQVIETNGKSPLGFAKVNIYLVEKKQTRDRSKSYFEATQQRQTSYCEIIPEGTVLETELGFDIDFLLQVKSQIKGDGVPTKDGKAWVGLKEKVQQLFGLNLDELTKDNKEAKRQAVIAHLQQCLNTFNQVQLKAYQDWLQHFENNDKRNNYTDRIKAGSASVLTRAGRSMMHLGYATGFDGMTALQYFLADDRRKALFKEVMGKFNLGNKPGNRGRYTPNPDRFPKSKRMVEASGAIQPMGWAEVFMPGEDIRPLESIELSDAMLADQAMEEPAPPAAPAEPEFYDKPINPKKSPELDAVVVKSGRPNRVKVYVKPDYMPELDLNGYSSQLETDTLVRVQTTFNKKKKLVQVAFRGLK